MVNSLATKVSRNYYTAQCVSLAFYPHVYKLTRVSLLYSAALKFVDTRPHPLLPAWPSPPKPGGVSHSPSVRLVHRLALRLYAQPRALCSRGGLSPEPSVVLGNAKQHRMSLRKKFSRHTISRDFHVTSNDVSRSLYKERETEREVSLR